MNKTTITMNKTTIIICTNLIYFRKQHGYSQAQLAQILAMTRSTLSSYEEYRARPSIELILNLCLIFNQDFESFCTKDLSEKSHISKKNTCEIGYNFVQF